MYYKVLNVWQRCKSSYQKKTSIWRWPLSKYQLYQKKTSNGRQPPSKKYLPLKIVSICGQLSFIIRWPTSQENLPWKIHQWWPLLKYPSFLHHKTIEAETQTGVVGVVKLSCLICRNWFGKCLKTPCTPCTQVQLFVLHCTIPVQLPSLSRGFNEIVEVQIQR